MTMKRSALVSPMFRCVCACAPSSRQKRARSTLRAGVRSKGQDSRRRRKDEGVYRALKAGSRDGGSLPTRAWRRRKCIARRLLIAGRARVVARELSDLCAERGIAQHRFELLHRGIGEELVAAEEEITLVDERHEIEAEASRRHFEAEPGVGHAAA